MLTDNRGSSRLLVQLGRAQRRSQAMNSPNSVHKQHSISPLISVWLVLAAITTDQRRDSPR